jgi:hypothetical protein
MIWGEGKRVYEQSQKGRELKSLFCLILAWIINGLSIGRDVVVLFSAQPRERKGVGKLKRKMWSLRVKWLRDK